MANERYGLHCPICGDCKYIGKTMCVGIYNNNGNQAEFLNSIYAWMWKHLLECHKEFQWGAGSEVLFEVIHEGHPDVARMMKEGRHWNEPFETTLRGCFDG